MSDQELIEEARVSYRSLDGVVCVTPKLIARLADALEAHQPRVIENQSELDALPFGSVVRCVKYGMVWELNEGEDHDRDWYYMDEPNPSSEIDLPALLLFVPREETTPCA